MTLVVFLQNVYKYSFELYIILNILKFFQFEDMTVVWTP